MVAGCGEGAGSEVLVSGQVAVKIFKPSDDEVRKHLCLWLWLCVCVRVRAFLVFAEAKATLCAVGLKGT